MKKMNKTGFTIVELVIVISVIAILSAVMIPTFTSVVSKSKDSAALQNARNAYTEYLAENAADEASVADFIYEDENGRFVAINNGQVDETVYKNKVDAVNAVLAEGETKAEADTVDGYVTADEANAKLGVVAVPEAGEGEGEGA